MSIYERFSEQDLAVLKQRAQRAASVTSKDGAAATLTALQIVLSREAYALPVELLLAVYEEIALVPVPGTPAFVAGIANIRGRILPVLDLAELLGVPDRTGLQEGALVVASDTAMTVAFLIDSAGEVVTFPAREVGPVPGNTSATQANYLRGVLADGTGLLDVAAILGDPDLIVVDTL